MPSGYFQAVPVIASSGQWVFSPWDTGLGRRHEGGWGLLAGSTRVLWLLRSGVWNSQFCSVDSVSTGKVNSWSPTSHGVLLGRLSVSHWMSLPEFSIRLWRSDNGFWVLSSFRILTSSRLKTKVKPKHDNAHLPSQLWGSGGRRTRGSKASLCRLGYRKPNGKKQTVLGRWLWHLGRAPLSLTCFWAAVASNTSVPLSRVLCPLRPPGARRAGVSSLWLFLASQGPRVLDTGQWGQLLPGSLFLSRRPSWAPPLLWWAATAPSAARVCDPRARPCLTPLLLATQQVSCSCAKVILVPVKTPNA